MNVLGDELQPCSLDPVTGYYRTGCCENHGDDPGLHVVCVVLTEEFLEYSKSVGNDLSTPMPQYGFAGLHGGDQWCLEGLWAAVTYFSLWAVRLSGFLENQRVASESRGIAEEMLRTPVSRLTDRQWTRETAQDLRRSLIRSMEEHMERKLYTAHILETL